MLKSQVRLLISLFSWFLVGNVAAKKAKKQKSSKTKKNSFDKELTSTSKQALKKYNSVGFVTSVSQFVTSVSQFYGVKKRQSKKELGQSGKGFSKTSSS